MSLKYNYDSLDFLLNIYNDYVYRKNPERQYIFKQINKKNIGLIDLKKPSDYDSTEIFNGEFEFLGYYNDRFHYKRKSKSSYPCQLSFGFYETSNNSDLNRGVLYNIGIMYILSEVVINEKYTHSVLPVMLFDVEYDKIDKLFPDIKKYVKENDLNIKRENGMYCLITEHFFEMMTLREYIQLNEKTMDILKWKALFFQILYALYKTNEKLNQFRHNRLNLDSIRVYTRTDAIKSRYKIGDDNFELHDIGFDIKLTDYDYSSTINYIPNAVNAVNTVAGKLHYDEYYDVYYFFNYLYSWIVDNNIVVPKEVIEFINEIVPNKLTIKDDKSFVIIEESYDHINMPTNRTIPAMILKKNNFFSDFIISNKKKMNMSASPIDEPNIINNNNTGSDFSESDYKRSITESESDNPRLLGKKINIQNKKSNYSNRRMSKKSNDSEQNIKRSESDTSDDLLKMAEKQYKKHNKKSSKDRDVSRMSIDDSTEKDDYTEYFSKLHEIGRSKIEPSKKKAEYVDFSSAMPNQSSQSSSEDSDRLEERQKSDEDEESESDSVSESDNESGSEKLNKKKEKKMKRIDDNKHSTNEKESVKMIYKNKERMPQDSHEDEKKGEKEKKNSQHKHKEKEMRKKIEREKKERSRIKSDSTSSEETEPSTDSTSSSSNEKKRSSKGKKKSNDDNGKKDSLGGYEQLLGDSINKKLKMLPDNYVGELPSHLQYMLPDENGFIANPMNNNNTQQNQKPNQMASLLGMAGNDNMNNGLGEMPQGFYNDKQNMNNYPFSSANMGANIPQMTMGANMPQNMPQMMDMTSQLQMPSNPQTMPMQHQLMNQMSLPPPQMQFQGQQMPQMMGESNMSGFPNMYMPMGMPNNSFQMPMPPMIGGGGDGLKKKYKLAKMNEFMEKGILDVNKLDDDRLCEKKYKLGHSNSNILDENNNSASKKKTFFF
jgi:hypothetical protein